MIASFADASTEDLFHGRSTSRARRFPADFVGTALRRLDALNAATTLDDLRSPSGNRLEALRGNLRGFHSVRINAQWRLVFRWHELKAFDVRIVDYHS